jgi:hypothetical protein
LNKAQLVLDTTAEAATSSFGGQAVSCPNTKAGRLSAAAGVPTQEVYRELNFCISLNSFSPQSHYFI